MAKFGTSSSIGMLATSGDGDGVNVSTGDGPCASTWDGDGLTSIGGGDDVGASLKDLTDIDTIDRDEIDNNILSLDGSHSVKKSESFSQSVKKKDMWIIGKTHIEWVSQ